MLGCSADGEAVERAVVFVEAEPVPVVVVPRFDVAGESNSKALVEARPLLVGESIVPDQFVEVIAE